LFILYFLTVFLLIVSFLCLIHSFLFPCFLSRFLYSSLPSCSFFFPFSLPLLCLFVCLFCPLYFTSIGAGIDQWYSAGLRDRSSGFESRQGLGIFLFTTASWPVLGPNQPPIQ
jgi:hypothetical protein